MPASLSEQLQFWNGHVRRADVAHHAKVHTLFDLAPGFHVARMGIWLGFPAARSYVRARRMDIRKRPVHQVEVELARAEVKQRSTA